MFELKKSFDYSLISIEGGQKDNVIPRDAYAILCIEKESFEDFEKGLETLSNKYTKELEISEADLSIDHKVFEEDEFECLHPTSFEKVLLYLINTPNGVQKMSSAIPGLVESSLNMGVLRINEEKALFRFSVRSAINSYKQFISDKLEYLAEFLGGEYTIKGQYPAWEYKLESPLRDHMSKVYQEVYGKKPKFEAIHAGLESSFFSGKIPDVDIVALGPNMQDIHSPQERLNIPSAIRVYQYLEKVIEGMNHFNEDSDR